MSTTLKPTRAYGHLLEAAEPALYNAKSWPSRTFHASSYVDCGRMQAYGLLGYEKTGGELVVQYRRDAGMGDIIHDYVQRLAVAGGRVAMVPNFDSDERIRQAAARAGQLAPAIEFPLKEYTVDSETWQALKRYRVGGKLDGLLEGRQGRVVWEIKTIASKYWDKPSYSGYYADKLAHYESQAQIYMHFLKLQKAVITVFNRERFMDWFMGRQGQTAGHLGFENTFQEFEATYNPDFMGPELERLERLASLVARNELPEPEPAKNNCKFCDYALACPVNSTDPTKVNLEWEQFRATTFK